MKIKIVELVTVNAKPIHTEAKTIHCLPENREMHENIIGEQLEKTYKAEVIIQQYGSTSYFIIPL